MSMLYICHVFVFSFYTESAAGRLVSRIASKRHREISLMRDYQFEDFVGRERALNVTDGKDPQSSVTWRYRERIQRNPLYTSNTAHISTGRVLVEPDAMSPRELDQLTDWAQSEGVVVRRSEFLESIKLNGIKIRTEDSEAKLTTCDSIICVRFVRGTDVELSDSDGDEEEFWFGVVVRLLRFDSATDVAVCVRWYLHLNPDADARAGLAPVAVQSMRLCDQGQCWVRPDQLVLQQHFRLSDPDGDDQICIKI